MLELHMLLIEPLLWLKPELAIADIPELGPPAFEERVVGYSDRLVRLVFSLVF